MELWESSIEDLFNSAEEAFPETGLRQHATQPIVIKNVSWIPYLGMRTLYVKGIAQNEDREYNPVILFKNVNYHFKSLDETVRLYADDGQFYKFEKLSLQETDVNLRCNCPDFKWRFAYYNSVDKSLYGRKPKKYQAEGKRLPANPKELPGMCKHLMKLQEVLQKSNLFKEISVAQDE